MNDYLREFYSHSNKHPHGWGVACLEKQEAMIEKEPLQAAKSHYLKERLSVPIYAKTAVAHIRYATIGMSCIRTVIPIPGKMIAEDGGLWYTMVRFSTIRPCINSPDCRWETQTVSGFCYTW